MLNEWGMGNNAGIRHRCRKENDDMHITHQGEKKKKRRRQSKKGKTARGEKAFVPLTNVRGL